MEEEEKKNDPVEILRKRKGEEESKLRLQEHQGAVLIRPPKMDFPLTTRILLAWKGLNKTLGKDPKMGSEYDSKHKQLVIYISMPGHHVTYLLKEGKVKD